MNYLGIDLGGTKTLIAVFDGSGNISVQEKIETNQDYDIFLSEVEKIVAKISTNTNIACAMTIPGLISRDEGRVHVLGNLPWKDKLIRDDISKRIGNIPVIIENDARIAGLAEAGRLKEKYEYVLYLTVSTGIGGALLKNGEIVEDLQDMEMGHMPLFYEDKIQKWENFASGKAIIERYGKRASDIDNDKDWQEIGERIGYGLAVCCSILLPEAVVFGGGVGQFADKFKSYTSDYLEKHLSPMVRKPEELLAPAYVENSALQGCFRLLQQHGLVK